MGIYLVTAYRWGQSNNHQYQVYCGPDRTKAIALAQSEREGRGGKYDCAVYEYDEDGTDCTLIDWFSSQGETQGPERNWRLDYFERLGHFIDAYAYGKCLLPDPEKPGRSKYTVVNPDPIVVAEVARNREVYDRLQQAATAAARDKQETAD